MSVRRNSGFTLLETVVALAIGTLVILGARAILEGLGAQATRLAALARGADEDANGERLLRRLLAELEVPVGQGAAFGGNEDSLRFSSWCAVPQGWQERCRVVLLFKTTLDSVFLIGRLSTRETLILKSGRREVGFRYLADPAQGGTWFQQWGDGRNLPLAIGILMDADTMIVRIGERG